MLVALLCPYIDTKYAAELDDRLEQLDDVERGDKLQQLVYHLQRSPEIADAVGAGALFDMNDATLAQSTSGPAEAKVVHELETYYALINQAVDSGDSNTMVCRECGAGGVEWTTKQTRSADEGSTVFCHCPKCKARWKM